MTFTRSSRRFLTFELTVVVARSSIVGGVELELDGRLVVGVDVLPVDRRLEAQQVVVHEENLPPQDLCKRLIN